MKTFFDKYLAHIRKQSVHNQRVHAFSISGLLTVLIAFLWLHFFYGFWSFGDVEVYTSDQTYETRDLSASNNSEKITTDTRSPAEVFRGFFEEAKKRMDSVPKDFSGVISDTKTFERPE